MTKTMAVVAKYTKPDHRKNVGILRVRRFRISPQIRVQHALSFPPPLLSLAMKTTSRLAIKIDGGRDTTYCIGTKC